MICKVCGRNIEEEQANYCSYCGYSFREERSGSDRGNADNRLEAPHVNHLNQAPPEPVADTDSEKSIGFGNWLGTMLLPMIPIIGWLVYGVMLFIWAFGREGSRSKRNWARAQLIVLLIGFVLLAYMAPAIVDILNGTQAYYDMSI